MRAQFEEKTFEQHLTFELVRGRNLFFPPGQVLEDIVGFDVALKTSHRSFWRLFPYMYPWWREMLHIAPSGVALHSEWWQEFEREIDRFPSFKFNCFVQVKRPNYMVRSDAAEYSSWNKPYFRYETYSHQHKALDALAQRTNGKAIVVYACPAFYTFADLWDAVKSAQLVQKSNFCEAQKLNGHERYTYVAPGNLGVACSDPTPIESVPFDLALEQLSNRQPAQSNVAFLGDTARAIGAASEVLGPLFPTYASIARELFQDARSNLAKYLASIYAFQFVCDVRLLIGHEG